jgi:hypothetical protein
MAVYFQSTFSLLSIGILSGSSRWLQDVSVVFGFSRVSRFRFQFVSCFRFQVSAVQDKSFSLSR